VEIFNYPQDHRGCEKCGEKSAEIQGTYPDGDLNVRCCNCRTEASVVVLHLN
jgi:hypothetical protein